jgi:amino acid permease
MQPRGPLRLRASLALIGTTIGAGVFAVPAMLGAWGVIPGTIGFALIACAVLCAQLLYTEAIVHHRADARLAGHAGYWLGSRAKSVATAAQVLQTLGSALAYLMLGGAFLAMMGQAIGFTFSLVVWQMLFWIAGVVMVLVGLPWLARVEAFLTWLLIAVMLIIMGALIPRADFALLTWIPQTWTFAPYGVFLFSLCGINVIPEVALIVQHKREDVMTAVIRGTVTAALLTYGFGLTVWLASSGVLGVDPLDVLRVLPAPIAQLLPWFGFLAIITSYITISFDLRALLERDTRLPPILAAAVALGVPYLLLLTLRTSFVHVIAFVGSLFSAIIAILAIAMGSAAIRRHHPKAPAVSPLWWGKEIVPVLAIGMFIIAGITWLLV